MNWKSKRNYRKSLKARTIYAVVRYAKWCVRPYLFAGKWEWDDRLNEMIPLVYHYDDHNGEYETIDVRKITDTTTGLIHSWTFNVNRADIWAHLRTLMEERDYD